MLRSVDMIMIMSSVELKPIVLYDIPCTTPGHPWSPNTMKTRYCLGYKQLRFTTSWVEFPDIVGVLQSKNITKPPYTLPAIEDPNTGEFITDSLAIATYLDKTYPETPKVLNAAARKVLEQVGDSLSFGSRGGAGTVAAPETVANTSANALVFLILAAERLNPVSKEYYHQTRAARLGERWTMLVTACAAGPEDRAKSVKQGIEAIEGVLHKVIALYSHQGSLEEGKSGGPFALGEQPSFLDFAVGGRIKFMLDGLTLSEAETLTKLDGGKLVQLVENLEEYFKY